MKNKVFDITIDCKTGYITSVRNLSDEYAMNWCAPDGNWGKITDRFTGSENHIRFHKRTVSLEMLQIDENSMEAVYSNDRISVIVKRNFKENGNLEERYCIRNISNSVITINSDNFGIELPLNDRYTFADDCMTNRCNTHIWCGNHVTWINALKMGESDCNLGIILTKGSIVSYSQNDVKCSNNRGIFVLEPETVFLNVGEEYVLQWEVFWHKGKEDFTKKLLEFDEYIKVNAKHYTVFNPEKIEFFITASSYDNLEVYIDKKLISTNIEGKSAFVEYKPERLGEHRFIIKLGERTTYADFLVKPAFSELLTKRIHFIVENQQCLDEESPLYGAYLIYDNETTQLYFDNQTADHNACRERLNMPLVLARYLQIRDDPKVRASLELFIEFVKREFYEEKTGEVFNTIGKRQDMIRLYNAPGVMWLFCEMYFLTKEPWYLDNILKLADNYYEIGGKKCYANGLAIERVMKAFYQSGRKQDAEKMFEYFKMHVDHMIGNGTSYPKHEVNYEQTIVTPTVTCISEMGMLSGEKKYYLEEVKRHLACLESFSGMQPSFHLNEIAIRYWDDFWFGKRGCYGDTLPHHLSSLTGRAYIAYYRLCNDKEKLEAAEECLRNCMCLIGDDGRGAAAYVYPHTLSGVKGEFYDEWANDQDISMYYAMNNSDLIEVFKI